MKMIQKEDNRLGYPLIFLLSVLVSKYKKGIETVHRTW